MALAGADASSIAALGIANQRETTIAWDRATGCPLYEGLVWLDLRTADVVERLKAEGGQDRFREVTGKGKKGDGKMGKSQMGKMSRTGCVFTSQNSQGLRKQTSQTSEMSRPPFSIPRFALAEVSGLPVSTYFSAAKILWLMENVPVVAEA